MMTDECSRFNHRGPSSDDLSDTAMRAAVQSSLVSLLPMMRPQLAEIFRRSELLEEPSGVIASSLDISVVATESLLEDSRVEMQKLLMLSAAPSITCTCPPHSTAIL